MDGSMERKVTCRTKKKGLQQYKWIKGEKPGINKKKRTVVSNIKKKKKIPPGAWMFVLC
jgi:hypothetical protein